MKTILGLLDRLLNLANGKKTTIGAILALVITYCHTKGYIDSALALLLNSILVALGLVANTANYLQDKK